VGGHRVVAAVTLNSRHLVDALDDVGVPLLGNPVLIDVTVSSHCAKTFLRCTTGTSIPDTKKALPLIYISAGRTNAYPYPSAVSGMASSQLIITQSYFCQYGVSYFPNS